MTQERRSCLGVWAPCEFLKRGPRWLRFGELLASETDKRFTQFRCAWVPALESLLRSFFWGAYAAVDMVHLGKEMGLCSVEALSPDTLTQQLP